MLRSVEDVISAVGGPAAAASLVAVGKSAVSNWKSRGAIPPEYFLTFSDALAKLEKEADPAVFGFKALADEVRA